MKPDDGERLIAYRRPTPRIMDPEEAEESERRHRRWKRDAWWVLFSIFLAFGLGILIGHFFGLRGFIAEVFLIAVVLITFGSSD